jgi:exodeoxyribonuclease VII small subunit
MKTTKKQFDFASAMKELEQINQWFQEQDIDLDEGLEKLKKAKELISQCRDRLKNVENEFVKIKDEFNDDDEPVTTQPLEKQIPTPSTERRFIANNDPFTRNDLLDDDKVDDDDDLPF